jgi:hypothetical protein
MALRRALVTAPLALLVALLAHVAGFGGGHAFGGDHGRQVLYLAVGGPALLVLAAVVWLGLTERDRRRGERALLALLPGQGRFAAAFAVLGSASLALYAGVEMLEGHAPLAPASLIALACSTALIAAAARLCARWLAAAGFLLAAAEDTVLQAGAPRLRLALAPAPRATSADLRSASRGRAPPLFA